MAPSNLELYEALKRTLDEEAARMIAEVVPLGRDVATKDDVVRLEGRIVDLDQARKDDVARLEGKVDDLRAQMETRSARMEAKFARWVLMFFVPLWITSAVAIVTSLVG